WIADMLLSFRGSVIVQVIPKSGVISMWTLHPSCSELDGQSSTPLSSITGLFFTGPMNPSGSFLGADHEMPLSPETISSPHHSEGLGPTLKKRSSSSPELKR